MKLLTFLARRFAWEAAEVLAADAPAPALSGESRECVVVFVHAERADEAPIARASVLRQTVKHIAWLARKRESTRCVLHSFTHLGAESADRSFARAWLDELADSLRAKGFEVAQTPFGYSCAWELAVHGESVAKVWKEIRPGGTDAS